MIILKTSVAPIDTSIMNRSIKLILFRPRNVVMYSDLTKYFILALLQQLIRYDALLGVIIV